MTTVPVTMHDELIRKAEVIAGRQGSTLDAFIESTVSAAIKQAETLDLFDSMLEGVDEQRLHKEVMDFMGEPQDIPEMPAGEIVNLVTRHHHKQ